MSERVQLAEQQRGQEVLVDGRRVPMLEAWPQDGGKVMLIFDRRLGVELTAENYVHVVAFVADVMKNVMHPECGRTFNRVIEITGASTDEA